MKKQTRYITSQGEIIDGKETFFADAMSEDGYRFPSHKMGARMFAGVAFPDELSDAEIGKLTRLSKGYLVGKTNMLGYRQGKEIKPYTASEIAELVGLRKRRGMPFINKMLRLRVIQKVTTNSGYQYYMNPAYFMANGQRLSLDLFLLFRKELTPLLPAWVMLDFLNQTHVKSTMLPIPNEIAIAQAERILKESQS